MRRLPRILLNAATLASLLLFVMIAALWATTYSRGHLVLVSRWWVDDASARSRIYAAASGGGALMLSTDYRTMRFKDRVEAARFVELNYGFAHYVEYDGNDDLIPPSRYLPPTRFGFGWDRSHTTWPDQEAGGVTVMLPMWLPATASAALPAAWLRRRLRRRHNRTAGHCPTCNYDLRATPDRCPECGTVPR